MPVNVKTYFAPAARATGGGPTASMLGRLLGCHILGCEPLSWPDHDGRLRPHAACGLPPRRQGRPRRHDMGGPLRSIRSGSTP